MGHCAGRMRGGDRLLTDEGKGYGEGGAAGGQTLGFDAAAMLLDDGHTDTQAQTGAATRALGGEEWVKDPGQGLAADAHAVVLKIHRDVVSDTSESHPQNSAIADLTDGLLGVGDQVQEDLRQLVRVTHHGAMV